MATGTYFGAGGVKSLYRCYLGQGGAVRTVKEIDIGQNGSVRKVWPMYNTGYGIMEEDCSAWYINQTRSDYSAYTSIGKVGDCLTINNGTFSGNSVHGIFVSNEKIYINPSTVILFDSMMVDATSSSVTASQWYFRLGLRNSKSTFIDVTSGNMDYYYTESGVMGGLSYGSSNYYYGSLSFSSSASVPTGEYYVYCCFSNYGTCTWYFPYGVRIFDSPNDVIYERSSYSQTVSRTLS